MLPDAQPSPSCLTTLSSSKMVSSATSTGPVRVARPRGEFAVSPVALLLSSKHLFRRSLCPDGLVFHPEKPAGEDPCDLKHNVPDKCKGRQNLQRPKPGEL